MRLIQPADILEHLKENMESLGKSVVQSHDMSPETTQYKRGEHAAYRHILSWLETNYSD